MRTINLTHQQIKKTAIAIAGIILATAAIWYAWEISTFSSLSESDATWWVRASEWLLIFSAMLLAVGLFGEWPDSESWKKRFLYKASKGAVIIGVLGELLGDGGIFSAGDRLQEIQGRAISEANTIASKANERAAVLNKEAAELRAATSARPWAKEQFDTIQEIKGVVTDVGILWASRCAECRIFGMDIEVALHSAGVQIYGAHESEQMAASNTGIFVTLPVGSDLQNHPLVVALRKARLNPLSTHHIPDFSKIRTDIPVIFVGERFPTMLSMPYQPPGISNWTMLPIEKP